MKTAEILNLICNLIAKIKGILPGVITRNSEFKKDLSMTDDEINNLFRIVEKVCFVIIENDEIQKLKTVENLLFLIQRENGTKEWYLFAGIVDEFGVLLNTPNLNNMCPEEFRQKNNVWKKYATKMVDLGCDISNWKF